MTSPRAAKAGVSSGSLSLSAISTITAIRVKAAKGLTSPSAGTISIGASAGPSTVPRPKLEEISESDWVRSARLVRAAT